MKSGGSNDQFMSDINVTPFVDVMLVLLIIFMVTAPMMMQGLNVDLPEATAKALDTKEENLIVTIDSSSQIFINDFQVTIETLQDKLMKILQGRMDPEVYLKADKTVAYGTVVQVMAGVKAAGVEKLGMITEPADFDKQSNSK